MNVIDRDFLQAKDSYTPKQLETLKKALKIQKQINDWEYELRHLLWDNWLSALDLHKCNRDWIFRKASKNQEEEKTWFRNRLLDIVSWWKSLLPSKLPK